MLIDPPKSISEYYARRDAFWRNSIPESERKVIRRFDEIVDEAKSTLAKELVAEEILDQQWKLNVIMGTLSELVAFADVERSAIEDYLEEKYAEEYETVRATLEASKPKVTKGDIESVIKAKYKTDLWFSRLLEERYRIYRAKLQSGERLNDTFQNQIIRLRKEYERTRSQPSIN